jgi:hypothetical protein
VDEDVCELDVAPLDSPKKSRVFPELEKLRVNEQEAVITMFFTVPSEENVDGFGEQPFTVTVAEVAELSIVTLIGCVTELTIATPASTHPFAALFDVIGNVVGDDIVVEYSVIAPDPTDV